MAWFVLKRGPAVQVGGLLFEAEKLVEVTDEALIRKLRGHKSFEEADGPAIP
ncbi:MAG TPA: hypothetical protein VFS91_04220 [Nitrobacter sp.]|nr:hypothetical protein [Nitrobacter sp.]